MMICSRKSIHCKPKEGRVQCSKNANKNSIRAKQFVFRLLKFILKILISAVGCFCMAVACLENHVFTPPRFLQFIPAVTGLLYVIAWALLPEKASNKNPRPLKVTMMNWWIKISVKFQWIIVEQSLIFFKFSHVLIWVWCLFLLHAQVIFITASTQEVSNVN